jgi:cobalt-zinc-cadmium efflux system membrane fusion protein
VLANDGAWRPGLFVEGRVAVEDLPVEVMVPKEALQTFEGRTVVFAQTDEGFEPFPVETGLENDTLVELRSGLEPGQRYAATGSFTLKAQLEKSGFASGHDH